MADSLEQGPRRRPIARPRAVAAASPSSLGALAALLSVLLPARAAHGRAAPDAPSADAPTSAPGAATPPALTPPVLEEPATAPYPEAALRAGVEETIELRLTIDVDGRVTEAEVLPSASPSEHHEAFASAARAAALRFVFEPARRDGVPVPARIRYAYPFRLPAREPEAAVVAPLAAESSAGAAPGAPDVTAPSGTRDVTAAGAAVPDVAATAPTRVTEASAVDITVQGENSARRLRRSPEAVQIVELERARQGSGDLSEVLSRSQGVGVRRTGGRGSSARLSLGGLTDDQIRFFVDGVPLVFAGFGSGLASVPVNLLERVEVYRGVVPIRFGEDALGGAINLVTRAGGAARASASYEVGSFGTYQVTAGAQQSLFGSPWYASVSGFWERSDNDYGVDVEVPDALGRPQRTRVRRLHDAYEALGGSLGVGYRDGEQRVDLRLFGNRYDKELQHNVNMTVPYGEVTNGESAFGGTLRYEAEWRPGLTASALAGYGLRLIDFEDDSRFAYDWFGQRVFERRVAVGELGGALTRTRETEHQGLVRVGVDYELSSTQSLRATVSARLATRAGRDALRADPALDPARNRRRIFAVVSGVEHELSLLSRRLRNILFVKDYVYRPSTEQLEDGARVSRSNASHTLGVGDALSFRIGPGVLAKASYEYATRLPRPDEVFGDGALVSPNLELTPEVSHNVNLGLQLDPDLGGFGALTLELNAFLRRASDLILLMPSNDLVHAQHQNIFSIRSLGTDAALGYRSPGNYLLLEANATWMNLRNVSSEGAFRPFRGDRVPNRPWLLANASATLGFGGLASGSDRLSLGWVTRYVHEFFPSWESVGARETKAVIPTQLVHSLTLGYVLGAAQRISANFELQNLTDEATYDFLGVQKPGRAYFFKGTLER